MLTLDQIKAKSAAKLTGLLPVVHSAALRLIERSYGQGIPIVITQGFRSIAEQDALYAQGRTKPGSVVTNAKGGQSFHNFGVAIDFALLSPDGKVVYWDRVRDGDYDGIADWAEVVHEAKLLGFAWGGDWTSFKDYPHFEMTFGLTTAQYRAGMVPSDAQIQAAMNKIQEGVEQPMTADERKKLEALEQTVREQVKLIVSLTDSKDTLKSWISKVDGRLQTMEKKHKMKVPSYAEEAVCSAVNDKLIDTPENGSEDFYRLLTVMHRKGLL